METSTARFVGRAQKQPNQKKRKRRGLMIKYPTFDHFSMFVVIYLIIRITEMVQQAIVDNPDEDGGTVLFLLMLFMSTVAQGLLTAAVIQIIVEGIVTLILAGVA
jgi:hypothetical protein